jgi:hypothetical protein
LSRCRDCGAEIRWVTTIKGHKMSVDAEPSPNGTVQIKGAMALHVPAGSEPDLHLAHVSTCSARKRDAGPTLPGMGGKDNSMTDAELSALAAIVCSSSRCMGMVDRERLANGCSVAYGDMPADGEKELRAELVRRGVLQAGWEVAASEPSKETLDQCSPSTR